MQYDGLMSPIARMAVVVALLGAGCHVQCGDTVPLLNVDKVEQSVAASLAIEPAQIDCPAHVPMKQGMTFTCELSAGGVQADVQVTQADAEGYVTWELEPELIVVDRLRPLARQVVEDGLMPIDAPPPLDCGGPLLPSTPGKTFTCKVDLPGEQDVEISVRVKDADANVSVNLIVPPDSPLFRTAGLHELRADLQRNLPDGVVIRGMTCPDDAGHQLGDTFECDLDTTAGPHTLRVERTADGFQGTITR